MSKPTIQIVPAAADMAQKALEWLKQKTSPPEVGLVTIAISGGTTPFALFRELTKMDHSGIIWTKIHLFWVDERCVLPDHTESNYFHTAKSLLSGIPLPAAHIHRIFGENDPSAEVLRYTNILKKFIPLKNSFPAFDLILLGIGEDGHTASIFPGREDLLRINQWCAVSRHPQTGQKRITLTGNVLNNAQLVVFLAMGQSKSKILKEIVLRTPKYPASHVRSTHGTTVFLLDSEAAEALIL